MGRYNKDLGNFGEDIAEMYLKEHNYNIICRNYLVRGGEIDIIATDGDKLVFIEVKTRSSRKFGYPSQAVDYKKIKHLKCAAEKYISENPYEGDIRFDIIEVYALVNSGIPQLDEINHIKEIMFD